MRCSVCKSDLWPDCGHLEGAPAPRPEEDVDAETLEEFEEDDSGLTYRRRGRPKLPPDMKRREKLSIAFTGDELKDIMIAAASDPSGPKRPQDWARDILIAASREKKP